MQPTPEERRQIEKEREMAAARYPESWAATMTMEGHRRRVKQKALRAAAVEEAGRDRVRAEGGRCGNCMHLLRNPGDLQGLFCGLDSGFHSYTRTKKNLCSRWEREKRETDR